MQRLSQQRKQRKNRAQQLGFEQLRAKMPRYFGGSELKSNPKSQRPLSTKHGLHLVMKSDLAKGAFSLLRRRNAKHINKLVRQQASRCGIKVREYVNVGNHIHMILFLPRIAHAEARKRFKSFVRSLSGLIARHVLEAERNSPKHIRFWSGRPFTRLVSFGRDLKNLFAYIEKNRKQARFWLPSFDHASNGPTAPDGLVPPSRT